MSCRRRERYRQGGGRGLLEAWVSRTSQTPASTINLENSTVQCQSGDRRFGCGWGRSCDLFYHDKWRVRPFLTICAAILLDFDPCSTEEMPRLSSAT